MRRGLSDRTSVGRVGTYRGRRSEAVQCTTTIARFVTLHTPGLKSVPLGGVELPPEYRVAKTEGSWTGVRYRIEWGRGDGVRAEFRTTLPGPLFVPKKKTLRLRFEFTNAPARVRDLLKRREFFYFEQKNLGRALRLIGGRMPALLITGAPVKKWHVLTHEHLELTFDRPGVPVMWVPLLGEEDLPSKSQVAAYLRIVERPPLHCREEFEVKGARVHVRQSFTDERGRPALVAPIPPLQALLGAEGGIQRIPKGRLLMRSLSGPYRYVDGDSWSGSIDSGWMDSRVEATRPVKGRLPEPPSELSYPGDVSWNPKYPMDGLITVNTWGPLAGIAPPEVWRKVKRGIHVPTAAALRKTLVTESEELIGRTYRKDHALFGERGDISYDTDWYSGKTLTGMYRGLMCADKDLSRRSARLVRESKSERRDLQAYMEIYHDWALGNSWGDPRGENWNTDCSHLGMGGVMAQAKMCEMEGDRKGAEFSRYLAAKMGVSFIAAYPLGDWCDEIGYVMRKWDRPLLGVHGYREWRGAVIDGPGSKWPYGLCPDYPEFQALLRLHGPVKRWRRAARIWERKYPERYRDWFFYYTGLKKDIAKKTLNQQHRIQAARHYHLAPEIALRPFVLAEDPDRIEKLYRKRPPSLAEMLWLRAGARLVPS